MSDDRAARRKKIQEMRDINNKTRAEGVPRAIRAGRLRTFTNAPDHMFIDCGECGRPRWRWQETCPKCGGV